MAIIEERSKTPKTVPIEKTMRTWDGVEQLGALCKDEVICFVQLDLQRFALQDVDRSAPRPSA